jgi:hypothetical protein
MPAVLVPSTTPAPTPEDQTAAWAYWRWNLLGGPATPPITLALVTQAVSATGPFAWLKVPLQTMTIRDWSLACYQTLRGDAGVPEWLLIAALQFLGWSARIKEFLQLWAKGTLFANRDSRPSPEFEPERWASARSTVSMLIASHEGSLADSWKRDSTACAAIALRPDEWLALAAIWTDARDAVRDAFGHDWVVLDISGVSRPTGSRKPKARDESVITAEDRSFIDFFMRETQPRAIVIVGDQSTENLPVRYRALPRQPRSLSDLAALAASPQPPA